MPEIIHVGPGPVSSLAREHRVRMRDGVRLATDVYLPDGDNEPGDTILIRLPYDKSGEYTFIRLIAEYFMAHGYRVVAQDVRGKFRSKGEALLFVNEAADGYDTIEWVIQQPWSNGIVAMWGDSYYGYTQWAAVSSGHPALKAISPRVTGTQLGEPVRRAPHESTGRVEWAITFLYPLTYFHSADAYFWDLDWSARPYSGQAEAFLEQIGSRSASYDLWKPRDVALRRFPFGSPFDARPVPTLHTIGWWDNCAPLSWADVTEIEKRPVWALNHFLRIESMDHESNYLLDQRRAGVAMPSDDEIRASLPRMLDPTIEFFDVFVRGEGRPADIAKVAWNLAGTEGMRADQEWPPPGALTTRLTATPDGRLTSRSTQPDLHDENVITWRHDPDHPVASSVADAFSFLATAPDEAGLGARDDVLVFDGATADHEIDFAGPVTVSATAWSTGPSMDLFARLLDVSPDGRALRIARGQTRLFDASQPTALVIDLGHLGYRLQTGHHLRLHVSSSDAPEFLALPGTGDDPWTAEHTIINHQSLRLGQTDGLALTLTILKGEQS